VSASSAQHEQANRWFVGTTGVSSVDRAHRCCHLVVDFYGHCPGWATNEEGSTAMGNLSALGCVSAPATVNGHFVRDLKAIRILIADGGPIFRQGLRTVIATQPDLSVVGEASDGEQAVKLAGERSPDMLLVDLAIPGLMALEVLRQIQRSAPSVRTIILNPETEAPGTLEALEHGARGVIPKDSSTELLFKAVRSVMAGQYWVGREQIADILVGKGMSAPLNRSLGNRCHLSPREVQIISGVLLGKSNKDIASKFGISENTVKHHLTHVFEKLGISNRLELALLGTNRGMLGTRSADYAHTFPRVHHPSEEQRSG